MKGKLIVIEGTDCSGKETQSKMLLEHLRKDNVQIEKFSFPNYDSPTGKIVGGPYLGKDYICDGWFLEGATNVDPKVASLYYAADRKYNIHKIEWLLGNGINVILDRYVFSNMAHQGGKIENIEKRHEMYNWLDNLEFKLLELPKPDVSIFLHMPYIDACKLKKNREEKADQHEMNEDHLKSAETSYLELAQMYNWNKIECSTKDKIKNPDEIHNELYNIIKEKI